MTDITEERTIAIFKSVAEQMFVLEQRIDSLEAHCEELQKEIDSLRENPPIIRFGGVS